MSDELPTDYPVTISLPVQWGDQDAFGHVNNVRFLRWFESSRIAYIRSCGVELSTAKTGPILAAVTCNYRNQVRFPDTIVVGIRVTRLGHSSITLKHKLWSERLNLVAADGESTVVMFDYQSQQPAPIPDEIRVAIEALEGTSFD
jgi:acyl-CoA thioester hydrolase